MGAAGSRVALDNPFPLDAKMNSDLDLLSVAISRILNTPDIYDINNLGRPGVCGDYAVFLRNQVEKKLLPFMATVDGKDVAVAYLNPRKSIDKPEVRKEVCKQLTGTILRVISIVVASLASIQVANQSRDTAVAGVTRQAVTQMQSQRGGGIPDVREWLVNNNYISAANVGAAGADGIRLNNPTCVRSYGGRNHLCQSLCRGWKTRTSAPWISESAVHESCADTRNYTYCITAACSG